VKRGMGDCSGRGIRGAARAAVCEDRKVYDVCWWSGVLLSSFCELKILVKGGGVIQRVMEVCRSFGSVRIDRRV
jgi:hypothetical protein